MRRNNVKWKSLVGPPEGVNSTTANKIRALKTTFHISRLRIGVPQDFLLKLIDAFASVTN